MVSSWTGIPVSRLQEGEREKLVKLEEHLHLRVVGQEEAIKAVSNAVRRARASFDPISAGLIHFSRTDWRWQNGVGPRAQRNFCSMTRTPLSASI